MTIPIVVCVEFLVITTDMAVSIFSVAVLENFCMILGVICVKVVGYMSLVIIFIKYAVVGSLIDKNVALVAWVFVTVTVSVTVSVDCSVKSEIIDVLQRVKKY